MDGFRRTLAGLCAAGFVLTALAALLFFNLERRAFDPRTYKQALARQNIYAQIPALVGDLMTAAADYDPCADNPITCQADQRSPEAAACFENALGKSKYEAILFEGLTPTESDLQLAQPCFALYPPAPTTPGGPPPFLANLSTREWQVLITSLLPPDELERLTDQALDSIFAVLNGRAQAAYLDLTGFKSRLSGPPGVQAVLALLRAQPPCTLEQLSAMTISALNLQGELEMCSPSPEVERVIQPLIEFNLQLAVLGIPDRAPLILPGMDLSGRTTPMEAIRILRLAMRLSPALPLLFLLGITLLGVRSLTGWLRWWGWPFLVVGIGAALIGFLSAPILSLVLTQLMTRRLPAYLPVRIVDLAGQVIDAIVREFLKPTAWEGILLIIGAAGMLFAARGLDARRLAASNAETVVLHD
jgi:hypothetical protein